MSNTRAITFKSLEEFHELIATAHVDINGFYMFDIAELNNRFRGGIGLPALLFEAPSSELSSETKMVSNFNKRNISFLIIDSAGAIDDYAKRKLVLNDMEGITLDITSYLVKCTKDPSHWLYGKFNINSVQIQKVGPLFDNMYGWNVLYEISTQESMCFVPEKWSF